MSPSPAQQSQHRIKRKPAPANANTNTLPPSERYPPPDPNDPLAPLCVLRSKFSASLRMLPIPTQEELVTATASAAVQLHQPTMYTLFPDPPQTHKETGVFEPLKRFFTAHGSGDHTHKAKLQVGETQSHERRRSQSIPLFPSTSVSRSVSQIHPHPSLFPVSNSPSIAAPRNDVNNSDDDASCIGVENFSCACVPCKERHTHFKATSVSKLRFFRTLSKKPSISNLRHALQLQLHPPCTSHSAARSRISTAEISGPVGVPVPVPDGGAVKDRDVDIGNAKLAVPPELALFGSRRVAVSLEDGCAS